MKTLLFSLILLTSCAIDYRTDYEINNGIVLTEEVIETRRIQRYERLRDLEAIEAERTFRQALWDCFNRNILECL